jgi:SAM-dependent methyltransferase
MQVYDSFSSDYDKFVNWEARLRYELPFIEALLKPYGKKARYLDAACGTGKHAIALAKMGYVLAGADLSGGMIKQAGDNATAAGLEMRFEQAGFGRLAETFGNEVFTGVLCLGNSLPHVLSTEELEKAVRDFARILQPGGIVIIQNRNFDAVLVSKERWMEPQAYQEGDNEWLFLRFYDYLANGLIGFNILTLKKESGGSWKQSVTCTPLRPLLHDELTITLSGVDFETINAFGDMSGAAFDPRISGNLVMTAIKKGSLK